MTKNNDVIYVCDHCQKEPEKLRRLPVINPDYIFIGTTHSRMKEKHKVLSAFDALKYVPKAVIFPSNSTAEVLLGVAREYKALGTKFYITGYDGEIEELEWI